MKRSIVFGVMAALVVVLFAGSALAMENVRLKEDDNIIEAKPGDTGFFDSNNDDDGGNFSVPDVDDLPEFSTPDITPVDPGEPMDPEDDEFEEEEFPDSDGDMVPDEDDDCIDVSGSVFNSGCPIEDEEELASLEELAGAIDDFSGEGVGMEFVGSCSLIHGAAVDVAGLLAIALGLVPMALGRGRRRR